MTTGRHWMGWSIKAEGPPKGLQVFVVDQAYEAAAVRAVRHALGDGVKLSVLSAIRAEVIDVFREKGLKAGGILGVSLSPHPARKRARRKIPPASGAFGPGE